MIKRILVIFFATVSALSISATVTLWATAYEDVYILKAETSSTAWLSLGVGCIPLVFAIISIRQVFRVLDTAHEEEMEKIQKLG